MWSTILTFLMSLMESKKRSMYGTVVALLGLGFFCYTVAYTKPENDAIRLEQRRYQDSTAAEAKLKEQLVIQRLDNLIENLQDLKDDNREIKEDIKGLLRRR